MGLFSTVPGSTWLYLALPRSAMIYLATDCDILPLTGLNASVHTGLNAQKLYVDRIGWMGVSEVRTHLSYEIEQRSAMLIIEYSGCGACHGCS